MLSQIYSHKDVFLEPTYINYKKPQLEIWYMNTETGDYAHAQPFCLVEGNTCITTTFNVHVYTRDVHVHDCIIL